VVQANLESLFFGFDYDTAEFAIAYHGNESRVEEGDKASRIAYWSL
jgi:hypothetical protein